MKFLRSVTLCAVDTRATHLAIRAMEKSMAGIEFADRLLFASDEPEGGLPGIRTIKIPRLQSTGEYSNYLLRHLRRHITTSHVLIVQWDGFVLNPDAWDDAFLEFDYVGAAWPQFAAGREVGNGGFSLRSSRLLEACADKRFLVSHPEDLCICHENRSFLEREYGIRFAPRDIAERFSYERGPWRGRTFGFHGFFNFPDFLSSNELSRFLDEVPNGLLCSRDSQDLILRLAGEGGNDDRRLAKKLLSRRLASCQWNLSNLFLMLRCGVRVLS